MGQAFQVAGRQPLHDAQHDVVLLREGQARLHLLHCSLLLRGLDGAAGWRTKHLAVERTRDVECAVVQSVVMSAEEKRTYESTVRQRTLCLSKSVSPHPAAWTGCEGWNAAIETGGRLLGTMADATTIATVRMTATGTRSCGGGGGPPAALTAESIDGGIVMTMNTSTTAAAIAAGPDRGPDPGQGLPGARDVARMELTGAAGTMGGGATNPVLPGMARPHPRAKLPGGGCVPMLQARASRRNGGSTTA